MSDRTHDGMLCPVCKVDLVMSERQGIEIDYCPKCRGVWLDRGELDKIIERSAAEDGRAAPLSQAAPAQAVPQAPSPWSAPPSPPPATYPPSYPDQHYGGHGGGHGGGHRGGHEGGYGQQNSFLGRLFR